MMMNINIQDLRNFAVEYVSAEPDRIGTEGFWQTPLLVSSPIDGQNLRRIFYGRRTPILTLEKIACSSVSFRGAMPSSIQWVDGL